MGIEKIDYRVMGDYSIAKSYKGILRIAHIMELMEGETDLFNNNVYYDAPSSLMNISGNSSSKAYGFPNASVGFEGQVRRYLSEKEYKNQKLPVTDSMGNYINWNLGTEDSTIGSDMSNNGYLLGLTGGDNKERYFYQKDFDEKILQSYVFPVIETKELVIGLEPKLISDEKEYFSKTSGLDIKDDEFTSTLVLYNVYDSSERNREEIIPDIESDGDVPEGETQQKTQKTYRYKKANYYGLDPITKEPKLYENVNYRTILRNDKKDIEEYDAFVYCQENYNHNNFNYELRVDEDEIEYNKIHHGSVEKCTNIDSEVNILNLKDYVKDIIKKFMKSNVVEVPTGTVISQYISPQKWYAKSDSGNGEDLTDENFVGHRPSMGQRNYEASSSNNDGGSNMRWNSSTTQGACLKTNRLNLDSDYVNVRDEEEEYDPTFDSSKLNELIPLYKRDYVLCDGSLYHIFLTQYHEKRNEIKRKYLTSERFLNLFYVIGYNYTFPKSKELHIFNDIKKRSKCKIEEKDGVQRLRFTNSYGNVIDETNFMNFGGSPTEANKEIKDGIVQVLDWNDEMMTDLKDCETMYSIDMATMLAFKLLIEKEEKTDGTFKTGGKYDRTKAEEWIKSQSIPREYIFNSFVGDTDATFSSYIFTNEAKLSRGSAPYVMGIPYDYTHGKITKEKIHSDKNDVIEEDTKNYIERDISKLPNVYIGREISSFTSLIKYYIPGSGYCVCELWQIPEIQYILDVMSLTGGERIQIFPVFFEYNFRVPNLTDTENPRFIGSTGYNWRDANEKMLENENSWSSSMSSGTVPHRHAVFKSMLTGFSDNANRPKFKGQALTGPSDIPSGSVNYHSRNAFPQGGKNGGAGKFVTDESGSYIWNELGPCEGVCFNMGAMDNENNSDDNEEEVETIETDTNDEIVEEIKEEKQKSINGALPMNYIQRGDFDGSYPNYYAEKNVVLETKLNSEDIFIKDESQAGDSEIVAKYDFGFTGLSIDDYNKNNKVSYTNNIFYPLLGGILGLFKTTTYKENGPKGTCFQKTGPFSGNIASENKRTAFPEKETTDFLKYANWYGNESMTWYSFWMDEDPRFTNFEPNRCITGPPVSVTLETASIYNKNTLNQEASSTGTCYYFAPENIKMLPLIKL